jgi:hypothetical protein
MSRRITDFNFDREYDKTVMRPVNENGYPFNPNTVNHGTNYYNWGFEYKIMPLSFNLQQKGNDKEMAKYDKEFKEETLYIGNRVTGVSPKDDEEHTGKIVNFTFTDCTGRLIKYVWIFDEKTMKRIYLDPETVNIIVPDNIDKNIRFNPFSTNFMGAHD